MAPLSAERNSLSRPVAGLAAIVSRAVWLFNMNVDMTNWAGQIWYGVNGSEGQKKLPSLIEEETARQRDTAGQIGTGKEHLFVFDNRWN